MPSNKVQVSTRLTDSEKAGLDKLVQKLGLNLAETQRYCIHLACEMEGIDIADTMPKVGTWKRDTKQNP